MSIVISKISDSIVSHKLFTPHDLVVVTLSGGADSVALLSALVALGVDCVAAHCNFHLRGEESMRDCRHAVAVAGRLGVECHVKDFDVARHMREHGGSTEMACRELRYEWFEQLRQELGATAIAVAHHRDDNIETMFLNLLRGTGIAGLSGMAPKNGYIIRPMLDCTRAEVEEYLSEQGLDYVTDSTNLENDFSRNRLRNIILPAIYEQFPGAADAIAATISIVRANEEVYRQHIDNARENYVTGDDKNFVIDLERLMATERNSETVLFEIIRGYGFNASQARDIIASAQTSGKMFYAGGYSAIINRNSLAIKRNEANTPNEEWSIDLSKDITMPVSLTVEVIDKTEAELPSDANTILLDATVLDGNPHFALRHWRKGDRLAPFGMKGTKKLSDIFSDAKLSLWEKSEVWLLTRNDEILWVVGHRTSRHYSITPTTSKVVRIKRGEG